MKNCDTKKRSDLPLPIAKIFEHWAWCRKHLSAKSKLKKCPLCRAKARFAKWANSAEVYCPKCGIRIERQTEEEVIAAWNRRAGKDDK